MFLYSGDASIDKTRYSPCIHFLLLVQGQQMCRAPWTKYRLNTSICEEGRPLEAHEASADANETMQESGKYRHQAKAAGMVREGQIKRRTLSP